MKKTAVLLGILAFLGSASPAFAGSFCLDVVGYCNDVRLKFSPAVGTSTSGFFSVTGREYGCGGADRTVSGSMRINSGVWYFNLTMSTVSAGKVMTQHQVLVYNPTPKTGTFTSLVVGSSGMTDASGGIAKVACPAGSSEPAFPEPDLMIQ